MINPIKKIIDHMQLFGLAKETQRVDISGVCCSAKLCNMFPGHLSNDGGRGYFRHLLLKKKQAWSSCNTYLSGITNFYGYICGR